MRPPDGVEEPRAQDAGRLGDATPRQRERLEALISAHARAEMVGWDFSCLDGVMTADEPWWDFEAECRSALKDSRLGAIDVGTGGGERLAALIEAIGSVTAPLHATEGWAPNVPVARARLAPLGIPVLAYDAEAGDLLDLPDAGCDLLMVRHESLDADEAARVLAPGGLLLDQQVDGRDAPELRRWFGGEVVHPTVTPEHEVARLERAGFRVDRVDRWEGTMRFADARALVVYMGLVSWDVPGFAVEDHAATLLELDRRGPVDVTQLRFRVVAIRR